MKRFAAVIFALCACVEGPPRETVSDERAINVAVEAWDAAHLSYPSACGETRDRLLIDAAPTPDVVDICTPDPAGIVVGCFVAPLADAEPLIATTTDPALRADTVVHEALHWLCWCSSGDPDAEHFRDEIWDGVYWDALSREVP